ncbi:hypothetical protein BJY52DRAFT_1316609 [Lactarius psammicola]|nr:hypothetical protein BJY52DRAFT_1316609 [Lactarius psammicola]
MRMWARFLPMCSPPLTRARGSSVGSIVRVERGLVFGASMKGMIRKKKGGRVCDESITMWRTSGQTALVECGFLDPPYLDPLPSKLCPPVLRKSSRHHIPHFRPKDTRNPTRLISYRFDPQRYPNGQNS